MFCIDLKDAYFHISNPFKFSTLPSDHFEWEYFSVQSVVHQPFHSIPCLHQSIYSGLEGGLQERDLSASLSQQLVDHSGVGSSPAGVSGAPSSTVSRPVGVSTWINETSSQPIGISTSLCWITSSERGSIWQTLGLPNYGMWRTSSFCIYPLLQSCGSRFLATYPSQSGLSPGGKPGCVLFSGS